MSNYILADLKRIMIRVPRLIMMLLVYAVLVIIIAVTYRVSWNSVNFVLFIQKYISFLPIVLGMIELVAVYADDFKAKTMQVAIGIGLSRSRVVFCKQVELLVISILDLLIFAIIMLGGAFILDAGLTGAQVGELIVSLVMTSVTIISYTGLTMIVMFYSQGTGTGRIVYLALVTGLVAQVASLALSIKILAPLHLSSFTLEYALSVAKARLLLGSFDLKSFLTIAAYLVVSFILTSVLFKKRELEF